jgi:formiminoglutamate deiminase
MGRAVIEAAGQAGIRITLLDACYLHGGIGKPLDEAQRRFADPDASAWADRVGALEPLGHARVGAAIHSVRAVDPESAASVAAWARERSLPLHAHVSEQTAENHDADAAWGKSPTAVLDAAGAVSERFTAVHLTHPRGGDLSLLSGATCCMCPTTERDLADGIGPAREMRRAGIRLALGSDSHAVIDQFEEARAVELDERLATNERGGHSAADLLLAGTASGHAAIGWPEAGRIEEGAIADLVTVSLESVRLAGTAPETALEAVVFAATAGDVRNVIAAGRRIVSDGRHVEIDVSAELAASIEKVYA